MTETEERETEQLIQERDDAEQFGSQLYYLVTGRSPEWSNLFGYAEATQEVEDALSVLKQAAKRVARKSAIDQYIVQIENTELDGLPLNEPALFIQDRPFNFATLNSSQKLLVIFLWGNSEERHLHYIQTLLKAKPKDVTWQDMLDACFDEAMRQRPNEKLAYKNRRD